MLRTFVLHPRFAHGGEPPVAPVVDLLVHVALWYILLACAAVAVHMVHSMPLAIVFGQYCQWNLSWTTFVLSSVCHVVAYSGASQKDLFVGLASCGRFA